MFHSMRTQLARNAQTDCVSAFPSLCLMHSPANPYPLSSFNGGPSSCQCLASPLPLVLSPRQERDPCVEPCKRMVDF